MSQSGGPTVASLVSGRAGWQGLWPGLAIVAIASLALYACRQLPVGTAAHIGPGAVSGVLAWGLLVLGGVIAVEGFWRTEAAAPASMGPAIALVLAGGVAVLAAGTLGTIAAGGLAAAVIALYGLRTRPLALALVIAAGVATAALAQLPALLAGDK